MSIEFKLKSFTPAEIAEITEGRLKIYGDMGKITVRGLATDSRECGKGTMFCAIKGQNVDGNAFIDGAADAGSQCALCDNPPDELSAAKGDFCLIVVSDTVKAMGKLAAYYRSLSKAKVVAVTGSVGKTTTKEFISAVSSAKFRTHKTEGNHNNEIGMPLTIFGIEPEDEVIVLEMGMSNLGEIEYMSKIARPDIGVITNIGTSHLASLGTRENICRAKMEITAGMSDMKKLVLNADEPLLVSEWERLGKVPVLFSVHNRIAQYRAVNIRHKVSTTMYDLISENRANINVEIPTVGKHNVYNSLVAYAVGEMLGMSDEEIREGLRRFVGVEKRQNVYDIRGITVIDDCYNASPESMRAAVDVLVSMAAKTNSRPAALLGDMLELGDYSRLMHDQLGQYVAKMKIQKLFCFGSMADVVAEAAIKNGIRAENVCVCIDSNDVRGMAEMVLNTLGKGDILLVKASRGIALERIIAQMKVMRRSRKPRKAPVKK